jgi:hypothetical protein
MMASDSHGARLAEYSTLRDEILMRIRMRNQILVFTIVVLGIVLSLSAQKDVSPVVFFVYPMLATFLALRWAWSDVRIWEIGDYIRTRIEKEVPGLHWEGYMHSLRSKSREGDKSSSWFQRPTEISAIGLFLGAGILATALGYWRSAPTIQEYILIGCDVVALVATVLVLRMRSVKRERKRKNEGILSEANGPGSE